MKSLLHITLAHFIQTLDLLQALWPHLIKQCREEFKTTNILINPTQITIAEGSQIYCRGSVDEREEKHRRSF